LIKFPQGELLVLAFLHLHLASGVKPPAIPWDEGVWT